MAIEKRKQTNIPIVSGWYWGKVNPIKHPIPYEKYYDAYSSIRDIPTPLYVYPNNSGGMYIETDSESEMSAYAEDYLWYGPVTPIEIEE